MSRLENPGVSDEPDPIVFGKGPTRPLEPRSFADPIQGPTDWSEEVGPIRLESVLEHPPADTPLWVQRADPGRESRGLLIPMLVVAVAAVVVGVGARLWVARDGKHPAAPPVQVAARAQPPVAAAPQPPQAEPQPEVEPQSVPVEGPPQAVPSASQTRALNLERLARSLKAESPPEVADTPAERTAPAPAPPTRPRPVDPMVVPPRPAQVAPPAPLPAPSQPAAPAVARVEPPPARPAPDAEMIRADQQLTLAYDFAMAKAADRAALHDEQAAWLAARERLTGGRESYLAMTQDRTNTLNLQGKRDRRRR